MRSSNIAALFLLRQGNSQLALEVLAESRSAVDALLRDNPASKDEASFLPLYNLLLVQQAVADIAQGRLDYGIEQLSGVVDTDASCGSVSTATINEVAALHLRRAQLVALVDEPHSRDTVNTRLPAEAIFGFAAAGVPVDTAGIAQVVKHVQTACETLPLGRALEAVHLVQLANVQRLVSDDDVNSLLSSAATAGEVRLHILLVIDAHDVVLKICIVQSYLSQSHVRHCRQTPASLLALLPRSGGWPESSRLLSEISQRRRHFTRAQPTTLAPGCVETQSRGHGRRILMSTTEPALATVALLKSTAVV